MCIADLEQAAPSDVSSTLSYDPTHELSTLVETVNGTTANNCICSYSANGDRIGAQGSVTSVSTTYGYDQNDQLTSFANGSSTATYSYDGSGLRASKTVGGTAEGYVWNLAEGLPTIIQDGSTKYVTGPGGLPLEQVTSSGAVLNYYQDQLGSTRGLVDSSGTTAATYSYDAYGNVKSSTGSVSNPFQYAGQYTDSESGLQYLRARYYDPSTQQFLTVDQLVGVTGEPYAYTAGNPLNGVDPFGLDCALFGRSLPFGSGGTCQGQVGNALGRGIGTLRSLVPTPSYVTVGFCWRGICPSIQADRYGYLYGGFGGGYNLGSLASPKIAANSGFSFFAGAGWITGETNPCENDIDSFLTGWTYSLSLGSRGIAGNLLWNYPMVPGVNKGAVGAELGVGTEGMGYSEGYTWELVSPIDHSRIRLPGWMHW